MDIIQRNPILLSQQLQNLPLQILNIRPTYGLQIRIGMQYYLRLTLKSITRRQSRCHHLAQITHVILSHPPPKLQLLVIHNGRIVQHVQNIRCLISLRRRITQLQYDPRINLLRSKLNRHPQSLVYPIVPIVRNPIRIGLWYRHRNQHMRKKGLNLRHYRKLQINSVAFPPKLLSNDTQQMNHHAQLQENIHHNNFGIISNKKHRP